MPRNITITFEDGTSHTYQNAPDNVTPEQVSQRAQSEFGKRVKALDGGRAARPAAPRPAPRPAPRQSVGNALLNSAKAVGGSIAKGFYALPDIAASAGETVTNAVGNVISAGGNALLRAHGANDLADRFTNAMAPRHVPTMGQRVDRTMPKPVAPGVDFAGQMLGGAIFPMPSVKRDPTTRIPQAVTRQAPNAAQSVVQAGQREGVRVMTSDVRPPRTFMGKSAQSVGEKIPFAGTGGPRAAQQAQRVEAVKALVRDFGGDDAVQLFDDAPGALDDVAKSLASKRSADLTRFTTQKNAIIDGITDVVPIDRTSTAIDQQIARLEALRLPENAPIIAKLQGWKEALQGQNLRNIEEIRKSMGSAFEDMNLASIKSAGQKALNAIYPSMRADMGTFIKNRAGPEAFGKWQTANQRLAAMAGELDNATLRGVLRTNEMTPENVGKLLFSKKPSDVARLYGNLDAFGRTRAQAAVLQRAFDKAVSADGGLSPERFVNNLTAMSDSVGVTFKGADRARIVGLTRLLDATRRASAAAVSPPTGVQNLPVAAGFSLGTLFGAASIPIAGLGGVIARAYESAPVRDALIRLGTAAPEKMPAMTAKAESVLAEFIAREAPVIAKNLVAAVEHSPVARSAAEQNQNVGGEPPANQGP